MITFNLTLNTDTLAAAAPAPRDQLYLLADIINQAQPWLTLDQELYQADRKRGQVYAILEHAQDLDRVPLARIIETLQDALYDYSRTLDLEAIHRPGQVIELIL